MSRTTPAVPQHSSVAPLHRCPEPEVTHACFRRNRKITDDPDGDRTLRDAVVAAQRGEDEALRYLYIRFKDNVYGYVLGIVHDTHDAEDLTQHVFMKLIDVIGKYEPRDVPFSSWVLRVARNVAVDHLRGRRLVPVGDVVGEDTHGGGLAFEDSLSLREALHALPDEQREVVVLRHLAGLSPGEIATRLDKTESAVHGLHHRGRGALKAELTRQGSAPATCSAPRPAPTVA
jgi:RNA polymerase sigma-70 factor, ECF subfamily